MLALDANPCDELMKTIYLRRGSRACVKANGRHKLARYRASSCLTGVASIFPVVALAVPRDRARQTV